MNIIKSVKPSGTYMKVRLLRPWCAGEGQQVRMPGDVIVCNDALADYLSSQCIGAVLTEAPDRPTQILVPGGIN